MSTTAPSLGLCRCGRTTALNDANTRKALICGHFICNECWTFGQPLPADPWCDQCIVALYHNDLLRRVRRHDQLEAVYSQKMKIAVDTIGKLKTGFSLNMQKNRNGPQVDSPTTALDQLPNVQGASTSSTGSSGTTLAIDWNSEQGKIFQAYLREGKKLLSASQNENADLKSRIAILTAQPEAKPQPDTEAITAAEKSELMEAELEGLHERLDTCEDELQKAQSELATVKSDKEEMAREVERYRMMAASTEGTMNTAYNQFTQLHNTYLEQENELATVKQSLQAKEKVLQSLIEARSTEDRTERENTAVAFRSLQAVIAKLNGEKADAEQTIIRLTAVVNEKEQEIATLEGRIAKSTALASELSHLHLAANQRSEAAEAKLISAQKEIQELKLLPATQQKGNEDVHSVVDAASELSQQSEHKSQIATLEAKLAEAARIRENAVAQAKSWERNRDAWKRWGEVMELRAKQAKEEALKAIMALSGEAGSGTGLQEPPPLTPFAMTPEPSFPEELGKTRKRPLDVPDTDVDGLHAIAQTSSDPAHAVGAESDRKKARLTPVS